MDEIGHHLTRCILSIFPSLTDDEIRRSDVSQLAAADSLAAVTLIALLNEEFDANLDLEELLRLGSFDAVRKYLDEHHSANNHRQQEPLL